MFDWVYHHSIVLMLIVFTAIAITAYLPSRRERMERWGAIPLNDDPPSKTQA